MKCIFRFTLIAVLLPVVMTLGACRYTATDGDRLCIEGVIAGFRHGIEQYGVSSMTANLTDAFVLTLKEGSQQYSKTLSVLEEELQAEETNQLYWRSTYGYRLELGLGGGTPLFNDRFATAHNAFTVAESATGIEPIVTDTGTIDWQFVKMGDYWRVAAMTITFDTVMSSTAVASAGSLPGSPFFKRSSR